MFQWCIQSAGMMREKQSVAIYRKWHCANVTANAIPPFRLASQNAIHPKMRQCRYTTRLKQANPVPSSRKDKCKPLALPHPANATMQRHYTIATPATQATQLYYKATLARHGTRHEPKESLFSVRLDGPTPLPHMPQRDSSQRGNPSPHKNSYFLCQ
jgi:hypothetical protein